MTAYKPIAHNIPSTWNEMRGLRVQSQLELHSERQGRLRATKELHLCHHLPTITTVFDLKASSTPNDISINANLFMKVHIHFNEGKLGCIRCLLDSGHQASLWSA